MKPNPSARRAALLIGGIFASLGVFVVAIGLNDRGPSAAAPATILVAAGCAFLLAGVSLALNALAPSRRIQVLQLCLGIASIVALVNVAAWAFLAPGSGKASVSFLFWKMAL